MGKLEESVKQIINDIDGAPVGTVENVKGTFLISLSSILKELLVSRVNAQNWAPEFQFEIDDVLADGLRIRMTVGNQNLQQMIKRSTIEAFRDDDEGLINAVASDFAQVFYKEKLKEHLGPEIAKYFKNIRLIADRNRK